MTGGQKRAPQAAFDADDDLAEVDFPRGGQPLLTPLERRQIDQQALADFEKEEGDGSRRKAKRAKVGG